MHDFNIEIGYRYRSDAILSETANGEASADPRETFGDPGARAPHAHQLRFACARHLVCELDSERVISSPDHAALATIMASNLQHEVIGDGPSPYAGDLRTAVGKAAQDAGTGQIAFRVVDCCGTIPFYPKVLSPLATHSVCSVGWLLVSTTGVFNAALTESIQLSTIRASRIRSTWLAPSPRPGSISAMAGERTKGRDRKRTLPKWCMRPCDAQPRKVRGPQGGNARRPARHQTSSPNIDSAKIAPYSNE